MPHGLDFYCGGSQKRYAMGRSSAAYCFRTMLLYKTTPTPDHVRYTAKSRHRDSICPLLS